MVERPVIGTPVVHSYVQASERVAELLQVEPGSLVLERDFVCMLRMDPVEICRSYVISDIADYCGLMGFEIGNKPVSMMTLLAAFGMRPEMARVRLYFRRSTMDEAKLLGRKGSVLFVQESSRALVVDGRPVEVSISVMDGHETSTEIDFSLDGDGQIRVL